MKVAVIGIGSNSLRMLLADIEGTQFERIKRYRTALRVFAALDENKRISEDMLDNTCNAIKNFMAEAKTDGAETFYLFATSAVRDAANQEELKNRILESTGLTLEICSGTKEAELSFLGAADSTGLAGLIDIGGGSTEIAIGKDSHLLYTDSLQLGAVRLWKQHPINSLKDIPPLKTLICDRIPKLNNKGFPFSDMHWTGVGGTLTTAAALLQNIPWNQKQMIHGYSITAEALHPIIEQLADLPLSQRTLLPSIQPQRADIIVHGLCILEACLQSFQITEIKVSEYGNLEGYIHSMLLSNKS